MPVLRCDSCDRRQAVVRLNGQILCVVCYQQVTTDQREEPQPPSPVGA